MSHHGQEAGAIVVYLASTINFIVEVVNPLLSTIGLILAIVWWVIKIKNSNKKDE